MAIGKGTVSLKIEANSVSILMGNVRESLQVRYKRKKIIESRYLSDKITMVYTL